jgi:hypothetical protein
VGGRGCGNLVQNTWVHTNMKNKELGECNLMLFSISNVPGIMYEEIGLPHQ